MELMQRLGTIFTDEYVDSYIEQILKYPGSCDNVWLPTTYGFPSLEQHRKDADFWKAAAEKFRKNGISVSLEHRGRFSVFGCPLHYSCFINREWFYCHTEYKVMKKQDTRTECLIIYKNMMLYSLSQFTIC